MFLHRKLMEQCSKPIAIVAKLRVFAQIPADSAVLGMLGRCILLRECSRPHPSVRFGVLYAHPLLAGVTIRRRYARMLRCTQHSMCTSSPPSPILELTRCLQVLYSAKVRPLAALHAAQLVRELSPLPLQKQIMLSAVCRAPPASLQRTKRSTASSLLLR